MNNNSRASGATQTQSNSCKAGLRAIICTECIPRENLVRSYDKRELIQSALKPIEIALDEGLIRRLRIESR